VGTSTITAAEGEAAGHVEFDFAVGGLIWTISLLTLVIRCVRVARRVQPEAAECGGR
jgi:hypothetical protein